ncbi:hypothetical protein ACS0TY_002947 [Phlomoides rotata]
MFPLWYYDHQHVRMLQWRFGWCTTTSDYSNRAYHIPTDKEFFRGNIEVSNKVSTD